MKQAIIIILKKFSFLFFALTFAFGIQAQNQDQQIKTDTLSTSIKSISEIAVEGEKINLRIIKLKEVLKLSDLTTMLDSLLDNDTSEIIKKSDSLLTHLENDTKRVLKVHKVEWTNYLTTLKDYQSDINNRTEEVSNIKNELSNELDKWKLTRDIFSSDKESNLTYDGLDKIIGDIEEVELMAQTRLDHLFIIQKKMIELISTVDITIYKIEEVELQLQKNYFVFDTNPIWESANVEVGEKDSISVVKLISSGFKENLRQVKDFLSTNIKSVVFQLLFILFLIIVIIRAKNKWRIDMGELTNPIQIQAKIILSNPFFSAIVLGLIISNLFYQPIIPAFAELIVLVLLLLTIVLLPKLTNKQFSYILLLILVAFFIFILETFLSSKLLMSRVLIIAEAIALIFALVLGKRIMNKFPEQFTVYKLFNTVSPIYTLILLVVILADFIGMMNLSRFLIKGILTSTILGMIVFLAIKAITSLIVMFFKLQKAYTIKTLSTLFSVIHQRILPILNLIGVIVWLIFTLKGFDVFDLMTNWVNELMLVHWEIGEATISVGGILSFLFIFITTLLLSKLTTSFFQDDWMINLFPRGVATAISLMLRIVLISIGFYLALSVVGIDLNKLGFIIGALGVGIGFGLQNVVLNFIAGLILAFERPINLGDAIEVDEEFGIVTQIGARACNIKSYSGYEVIIPNGDLISKKVINYTLNNNDRRSKILMKTSSNANPEKVITLFNKIASENPNTFSDPAPNTFFYGYSEDGNLNFALIYWSTFSDTLNLDHEISLEIFKHLKKEGIEAPMRTIRIINED